MEAYRSCKASSKDNATAVATVRRQGFWDQERPKLRESSAHLVGFIMRHAGGDASAAFRVFSV